MAKELDSNLSREEVFDQVYHDGNLRVAISHMNPNVLSSVYPMYAEAFAQYMQQFGSRDETTTWAFA